MPSLRERLDSSRAVLLDVGAGIGAVTIEHLRRRPRLSAVALEPREAARRQAERNVANAGLVSRIEVRAGRIEDLDAEQAFDLVWLPGNFLGPDLLPTVHRALRPGGYVINASLGTPGERGLPGTTLIEDRRPQGAVEQRVAPPSRGARRRRGARGRGSRHGLG